MLLGILLLRKLLQKNLVELLLKLQNKLLCKDLERQNTKLL